MIQYVLTWPVLPSFFRGSSHKPEVENPNSSGGRRHGNSSSCATRASRSSFAIFILSIFTGNFISQSLTLSWRLPHYQLGWFGSYFQIPTCYYTIYILKLNTNTIALILLATIFSCAATLYPTRVFFPSMVHIHERILYGSVLLFKKYMSVQELRSTWKLFRSLR